MRKKRDRMFLMLSGGKSTQKRRKKKESEVSENNGKCFCCLANRSPHRKGERKKCNLRKRETDYFGV